MTALVSQPREATITTIDGERRAVLRECSINRGGHWYCVTHAEHTANNLEANFHEQDGEEHEAVWLCDEHGPEGVPA